MHRLVRPALAAVLAAVVLGCAGSGDVATPLPSPGPGVVVHATAPAALHPSVDDYPSAAVELTASDGTVHRLAVRVAATDEQREHGLMEVPEVPDGTGMVFVYDSPREGAFTMRGTLTPLQIAWADADGTIVALADMVPCTEEPCPSYPSGAVFSTALEVRAGWYDEVGVGLGDTLEVLR